MNNRRRGHNWERTCIKYLSHIFPNIKTSRYASKMQDDLKVDLCFTEDYNFQCKLANKKIDYAAILESMPEDGKRNIILHKLTKKTNERFLPVGEYAIVPMKDFIELLEKVENGRSKK
jgi:hypothetical protein